MEQKELINKMLNIVDAIDSNINIARNTASMQTIDIKLKAADQQCEQLKELVQQLRHHPTDIFES